MAQSDDFEPDKKLAASAELSATVPDIFASMAERAKIPEDFTLMKLCNAGTIKFPGAWQAAEKRSRLSSDLTTYNCSDSLTAQVSIGSLQIDARGDTFIKGLRAGEARALQNFELAGLLAALSESRRANEYEITTGSTELLCDKAVVVLQGQFKRDATKEALIIFPTLIGYGHLSLKAIKAEYGIYFNYLCHALKTIQWG